MVASRVLIAEDEFVIAKDIETSLKNMGYLVCAVVPSGEEAIKRAEKEKPDLVLMDIILAGSIDGIEAARQIRAMFNIPVVYLTAYADENMLERAKTTEPFGYIVKPFNDKELNTAIEIALYKHKMEKKLRASEEQFKFLVENMADIVWSLDLNLHTTYVSPSIEKVLGFTTEERKQQVLEDIVTPDSLKRINETFSRELDYEKLRKHPDRSISIELEYYHKNGTTVWLESNIKWMRAPDGELIGIYGASRDITERKQAEAERLKVMKLESLGMMAGCLAHDFNNLLSIILTNIELAKDDMEDEKGGLTYLAEAEKATLKSKDLTERLIPFFMGGEPAKEILSIGALVKETASLISHSKDIRYKVRLQKNLWLAEFDEDQMKHVIKNILDNSVEAMPKGGSIDISAENLETSIETAKPDLPLSKGKYVKITIRDQGVGISEDHLPLVFDPYFSTKNLGSQKGLGLGLATAYSIIKRHDAHITVESEVGVGTVFTLYLPAYEKAEN